ncbi:MAG: hypothetical protein U0Q12_24930 [Vicinamibacterales bacterium]
MTVTGVGEAQRERVTIADGRRWVDALDTHGPSIVVDGSVGCRSTAVETLADRVVVRGTCERGTYERTLALGPDEDVVSVSVQFTPAGGTPTAAVEDRLTFAPPTRGAGTPTEGPLDLVWSQNIKGAREQVAAHWSYKSPAVIFQQGRVTAAIVPRLDLLGAASLRRQPTALDLGVPPNDHAWLSYGAVSSAPVGHSYFVRTPDAPLDAARVEFQYWIVASSQPERLGYRRVTTLAWEKFGHPALVASLDLQRNVRRPELLYFDDWRQETWSRYAGEKYWDFDCGNGRRCGALTSNRNPWGKWDDAPKDDAWFNAWFQNLRTAYGWYLHGRRVSDDTTMKRAEQVLNLALASPRRDGAFSTIYVRDTNTWIREDGWAGYPDDYHTFCMSWTGYWMLRWAGDLLPARKAEILAFLTPYGDLLLAKQRASGAIPSWLDASLQPRTEFGEFNAETAGSALFLSALADLTADTRYRDGALRAMTFITREVLPRQRWYDFETFLSCARKPFDFYDGWTAQYPQNNLSTMQAAQAYLSLYRSTKRADLLATGEQVVDYLLLTQQVWNHPLLAPKLLGGTTTQNTDAEWSDARQAYLAPILVDYYGLNGRRDYLERAVAAVRSGFAVAPWENWAHNGFDNEEGALTGIHWGTGSEMTSVEMMSPVLGDAFVDVARRHGVGFNASTVTGVRVSGVEIAFDLKRAEPARPLRVRFAGIDRGKRYRLIVNGRPAVEVAGDVLSSDGFEVTP